MKKIAVLAPYVLLADEKGYNRFIYLCKLLAENGFNVELFTSTFSHLKKQQRDVNKEEYSKQPYKINFVYEPGYSKNINFKRIISHSVYAKNLKKSLVECLDIDLIYCAIPTPDATIIAGKYAKSKNIPFIIDVQDIWPEAMKLVLNIPVLSDCLFLPLKITSDLAYSMANSIVAVSDTYLQRALRSNKKAKNNSTVYIGTDLKYFDEGIRVNYNSVNKLKDEFWVTYIGTLGTSYDIKTLISAIRILHNKGLTNIRLMVLGDGPLREKFESCALLNKIDAVFTGMIPYEIMAAYLKKSDIVANAIRKNAAQSITNKIGDFLSAGKPIINGSKNEEFTKMIKNYKIGYNYEPEDAESMAEVIKRLYDNEQDRKRMGINARKLAEERFDRNVSYLQIIDLISEKLNK